MEFEALTLERIEARPVVLKLERPVIARIATTISRMRAAGRPHSELNRFSMCGRTCEPRPSRKRPLLNTCRP